MKQIFHNPSLLSRSWYALLPSSALKAKDPKSVVFFKSKVALFRDETGKAHALHAYCPHMGADLGVGKVVRNRIFCPYHQWGFDSTGNCATNGARAHVYPTVEKFGYIWIFNGHEATFAFPELSWSEKDHHVVRLPATPIPCHAHVIGVNNPDLEHLVTLHGLKMTRKPLQIEADAFKFIYQYTIDFKPRRFIDRLFGLYAGLQYEFEIQTHGDNNVVMDIRSKNFHLKTLISMLPTENGHSIAKMTLFIPKGKGLERFFRLGLRKLPVLLASILNVQMQDMMIYENIRLVLPVNNPFMDRYRQMCERLGAFDPTDAQNCLPPQLGNGVWTQRSHPFPE